MTFDERIKREKNQFDLNREEAKIPTLYFKDINKCEYLTGKEILKVQ